MAKIIEPTKTKPPKSELLIRWGTGLLALIVLVATVVWSTGLIPGLNSPPRSNSIMTIAPYRHNGTWVFDDLSAGLVQEPFIAGVPEMIDVLVKDIQDAEDGFRLTFSAIPFPGHQRKLTWQRAEAGGNYYSIDDPAMEGWLCPAMFQYFREAPKELFVKAEPRSE